MLNERDIHTQQVKALREGSYHAFTNLYTMYSDSLYNFAVQLTKSPSEAEDIVQETFLRIWTNKKNLTTDKSFKAYIYQIARNLFIDAFRKQVNKVSFEQYVNSSYFAEYASNDIEDKISHDDFLLLLEIAKEKMTERQREIFILSREKRLEVEQIANLLNLSEKTVRNTLSLAIGVLKTELLLFFLIFSNISI